MSKPLSNLVASYRAEPTLCLVGDNLPRQQWLWKQYAFMSDFAKPVGPLYDNDNENLTENLAFVVHEMFWDINERLKKYGLQLVVTGGNLYLTRP